MAQSFSWRPLDKQEDEIFRKTELGKSAIGWKQLSILGMSDDYSLKYFDLPRRDFRVWVGDGQYITDSSPAKPADNLKEVSLHFDNDHCLDLLKLGMHQARVRYINRAAYPRIEPIYVETIYMPKVVESLIYVDNALNHWHRGRSIFSKMFGAGYPDPNGEERSTMVSTVASIITGGHRY